VVDQQDACVEVVADRAHDRLEIRHLRLGQPRRGLVQQHEAGIRSKRPGDAEPTLVSVRERRGRPVGAVAQREQVEQPVGAAARLAR
jgi:hypothetical protein